MRRNPQTAGLTMQTLIAAALLTILACTAYAEDPLLRDDAPLRGEAPTNHRIVGKNLGGYYYASKPLKDEYDKLLGRVNALRVEIVGGKISSKEAAGEVRELQSELQRVRQLIDATKNFVAIGKLATKTEITEFELGPEKLIFINGVSKVRLIGWDQPNIKCVVDKSVVGDGTEPLDDHFSAIRMVHRHEAVETAVGRSPEKRKADEEAFLASPDGKKLSPQGLLKRQAMVEKILANEGYFQLFQDKTIDYLELEGLTYQTGNRQVQYSVFSPGGGNGRGGSMWQRYATVTLYVPNCKAVGIHGGGSGLEVEGVKAQLIVRGDGNRDCDSNSYVKDHDGPVTIENIQIQTLDDIRGNVSVTVSAHLGDAGTRQQDGTITTFVESPAFYNYRKIGGDFTAILLKTNLQLSEVAGCVDITNDFGDTQFIVRAPLASAAHRILSESGSIHLQLAPNVLKEAPLLAVSECGSVRVAESIPELVGDGHSFSFFHGWGTIRRSYRGIAEKFVEKNEQKKYPSGEIQRFDRAAYVFTAERRDLVGRLPKPGLDVLSRSGSVQIEAIDN